MSELYQNFGENPAPDDLAMQLALAEIESTTFDRQLDYDAAAIVQRSEAQAAERLEARAEIGKTICNDLKYCFYDSRIFSTVAARLINDSFNDKYENPEAWLTARKHFSFIRPVGKNPYAYGTNRPTAFGRKLYRLPFAAAVLSQTETVRGGRLQYESIGLVDRTAIPLEIYRGYLNRKEPHFIKFTTPDKLYTDIEVPTRQEIDEATTRTPKRSS